jgi:chromosome segregation ATPase
MKKKHLKLKLRELIDTCNGWRALYADVCSQLQGAKAQLADEQHKTQVLTHQRDAHRDECTRLRATLSEYTDTAKVLRDVLDSVQHGTVISACEELKSLRAKCAPNDSNTRALNNVLDVNKELNAKIDRYQAEITSLRAKLSECERASADATAQIKSLQDALAGRTHDYDHVWAEAQALREERDATQEKWAIAHNECVSLRAELSRQVAEQAQQLDESASEVLRLRAELLTALNQRDEAKRDADNLADLQNAEIARLTDVAAGLRRKLHARESIPARDDRPLPGGPESNR